VREQILARQHGCSVPACEEMGHHCYDRGREERFKVVQVVLGSSSAPSLGVALVLPGLPDSM
jgi:hypothetical protein